MMPDVPLSAALLAGFISFLSPCVLPLVPPYLCFITGASLDELSSRGTSLQNIKWRAIIAALCFVAGFSAVFILLGATAGALGHALRAALPWLSKLAGLLIILMGLHFLGLLRIRWLDQEMRYHQQNQPQSLLGSFGVGTAFAFGWTPCLGPVLAAILSLAASEQQPLRAAALLAVYSAGLGIPFVAAAFSLGAFMGFFSKFKAHLHRVEQVMGGLLVLTGLMFLTGSMQRMAFWLLETFPKLGEIG